MIETNKATHIAITYCLCRFVDSLADVPDTAKLPAWLTQRDIDTYVAAFKKTGFAGGLNWYDHASMAANDGHIRA